MKSIIKKNEAWDKTFVNAKGTKSNAKKVKVNKNAQRENDNVKTCVCIVYKNLMNTYNRR